jgi:hypothetical protein
VAHSGRPDPDPDLTRSRAYGHDIIADIHLFVVDRMEYCGPHDPPPVSQNVRGLLRIK